jgi:hypothetical protein
VRILPEKQAWQMDSNSAAGHPAKGSTQRGVSTSGRDELTSAV